MVCGNDPFGTVCVLDIHEERVAVGDRGVSSDEEGAV